MFLYTFCDFFIQLPNIGRIGQHFHMLARHVSVTPYGSNKQTSKITTTEKNASTKAAEARKKQQDKIKKEQEKAAKAKAKREAKIKKEKEKAAKKQAEAKAKQKQTESKIQTKKQQLKELFTIE